MTRKDDSRIIRIVHPICCGLDVHKESVSACVIFPDSNGEEQHEIKVFGTFTDDLKQLRQWLLDHECPVVVMESTGVYWRPVHNVLEQTGSSCSGQIVVYGQLGGVPFFIGILDSVDKIYTSYNLCQVFGMMESNPSFFCALCKPECHCYNGL